MKQIKSILSAAVAATMLASVTPVMADGAATANRRLLWRSEDLQNSAIPLYMEDYKNGTWVISNDSDVTGGNVASADYNNGSKGSDVYENRINTAEKVYGKFGKAADDAAVNMHTKNMETASPNTTYTNKVYAPEYLFTTNKTGDGYNIKGQSNQKGGYQRYSFDIAFTEPVTKFSFSANNPDAGNTKDIFTTSKTSFQLIGGSEFNYSEPLQSEKWYHIEILMRSGEAANDTSHHIWLYIDGQYISESDFTWNNNSGASKIIKRLKNYQFKFESSNGGSTTKVFSERDMYFDNVNFEYWTTAPASAPLRDEVNLSTDMEVLEAREINGVYVNIDPSITVAQYKKSLIDSTLTVIVRDKRGNTVADTDSLAGDGNYIELTASDGTKYYKNAYASKVVWEKNFENDTLALTGEPSGGMWGQNNLGGAKDYASSEIANGTCGKKSDDKVYTVNINNYTGAYDQFNHHVGMKFNNNLSTRTGDKIIVEYSMAYDNNDQDVRRWVRFTTASSNGQTEEFYIRTYGKNDTTINYYKDKSCDTSIYGTDLSKWNKHTVVFTQGSKKVDFYLNGVLKYSDDAFLTNDFAGLNFIRFMFVLGNGQTTSVSGKTSIDDIKISVAPQYTPDTDMVTSSAYTINDENNTINVGEGVSRDDFDANVLCSGYYVIYDDETMTSTDMADMLVSAGMKVFAKNSEGIIKLYDVVGDPEFKDFAVTSDDAGKSTASCTVVNNASDSLSGNLIICSYEADDRFSAMNVQPFTIEKYSQDTVSVDLSGTAGKTIKVFVWQDLSGLKSLCPKYPN